MRRHLITFGLYLVIIAVTAFIAYFLGFRNGIEQTALNYSSSSLMFFTGIHQRLVDGDYESAKTISAGAASCQIAAFELMEKGYPLTFFMFPIKGQQDMRPVRANHLIRAFDHFSKYPKSLKPEEMTFLEKVKNAQQAQPADSANPRPSGTSVTPPAVPAARAGVMPEASGDS